MSKKQAPATAKPETINSKQVTIVFCQDDYERIGIAAANSKMSATDLILQSIVNMLGKSSAGAVALPACPFCRRHDVLEIIDWTSERRDQSEYYGEAVKCHRCEAIAPLAVWQGGTI